MILVAGGTGRLGSQVVAGLLAGGHEVRVLARGKRPRPPAVIGVQVVEGSVTDPTVVGRAVAGVDVVVSAVTGFPHTSPAEVDLEGTRVVADAAGREGAEIVLLSVAGASADSPMELFRAKSQSERVVERAGVAWTVIRPEAFADLWIELLTSTATRNHRPLVFGPGNNPRCWVAVRDVAALTVRAAEDSSLRGSTLTVVGPESLTPTELASRVMAAHGWPGTPRHVPTAGLRLASLLPGRAGRQAAAALAMDATPLVSDNARQAVPGLPCTPVETLLAAGSR